MPTDVHAAVSAVILADFLWAQLYLNMAAKRLGVLQSLLCVGIHGVTKIRSLIRDRYRAFEYNSTSVKYSICGVCCKDMDLEDAPIKRNTTSCCSLPYHDFHKITHCPRCNKSIDSPVLKTRVRPSRRSKCEMKGPYPPFYLPLGPNSTYSYNNRISLLEVAYPTMH